MQDYLRDTNHVNAIFRNDENVWNKIRTLPAERKWILSNITLGEIVAGQKMTVTSDEAECERLLDYLRRRFTQLPPASDLAEKYGNIIGRLAQNDPKKPKMSIDAWLTSIGVQGNDVWLVAEAWSHRLTVATSDKMEKIKSVLEEEILNKEIRFDDWR